MFKRIDRSQALLRLLSRLSDVFAKQRGLPIVIGIGFVIVSFILQTLDVFVGNQLLELLGVFTHHLGVLIALIGIVLMTPLGR